MDWFIGAHSWTTPCGHSHISDISAVFVVGSVQNGTSRRGYASLRRAIPTTLVAYAAAGAVKKQRSSVFQSDFIMPN